MSKPRGRPPIDNPRRVIERFRCTTDEHTLIAAAAERAGQTVADWLRARAVAAAKRSR